MMKKKKTTFCSNKYVDVITLTKNCYVKYNLRYPGIQTNETHNDSTNATYKISLWKQRTHKITEIGFGLTESLDMKHCSLRGCIRPPSAGSMVPKEIKYNLHYDDVRGDFLQPLHQLQLSKIKVKKDCLWQQRTHKSRKSEI